MADLPGRTRGVRLGDLDRSRRWVLGYTGRRWEVLGPLDDAGRAGTGTGAHVGAGDGVASTTAHPARTGATTES